MFRLKLIPVTVVFISLWILTYSTPQDNKSAKVIRKKRYYEEEFSDVCEHEININIGIDTITSPDYPEHYPSNANCSWKLIAPIDQKIRIVISKLVIEESVGCSYDYLIVHDGPDQHSPVLQRFCGQATATVLETSANNAFIKFVSDDNYEEQGFALDYLLQTDSSCNSSLLVEGEGIVTSPNYPSNYPDGMNCWIHIRTADDTAQIAYAFPVMDLEPSSICEFDYVAVYDGNNPDAEKVNHLCQDSLSRSAISSGSELLVHFSSDHLLNSRGFVMKYSVTTDFNPELTGDYGECSWEIEFLNGTIASPGFPENYENEQECQFTLEVPPGQKVQLTVKYLDLQEGDECEFDYLEIRDGRNEESNIIDVFCGRKQETVVTSSENYMYVYFRSDDNLVFKGFQAEYHAISHIDVSRRNDPNNIDDCHEPSCNEVIRPIVIQTQPQNISLLEGEWHSFSCTTENKNDVVMWFKDLYYLHAGEETIIGVEKLPNNTLLIKNMNWKLEGVYTCVILSASETKSISAWISLKKSTIGDVDEECEIKFDNLPTDKALMEGGISFLRCSAVNADVTWWKDGILLSSLELQRVHVARPGLILFHRSIKDDSGIYTCFAVNKAIKCNATIDVRVEILPLPADNCGIPTLNQPGIEKPAQARIVGGTKAEHGAIPWQVMLWEKEADAFCGGSVISSRWIVSAAHCIVLFKEIQRRELKMSELSIKLGKHDRVYRDSGEIISGVKDWIIHPNYNRDTFDNDIVLLRLEQHIPYTDYVKPICLGTTHYLRTRAYDNAGLTMGTVSGWGEIKYQGERPRYLQMLQLPMQNKEICRASTNKLISDNMFCAGYSKETSHDACRGDSGGPFAVRIDQRWYLAGIVSWGEECGQPGKFGVYTKVGNYYQWIQDTMHAYEL